MVTRKAAITGRMIALTLCPVVHPVSSGKQTSDKGEIRAPGARYEIMYQNHRVGGLFTLQNSKWLEFYGQGTCHVCGSGTIFSRSKHTICDVSVVAAGISFVGPNGRSPDGATNCVSAQYYIAVGNFRSIRTRAHAHATVRPWHHQALGREKKPNFTHQTVPNPPTFSAADSSFSLKTPPPHINTKWLLS